MTIQKPSYLVAGVIVGAIIGIFETLVVNLALVEISISPFFSLYFGILFLIVGGLIFLRVHNHDHLYTDQYQKMCLMVFAGAIIFSGFLCFLLDRRMFAGLASWLKVPLYGILGLSIAFALTFSAVYIATSREAKPKPLPTSLWQVDVLNYLLGFLQQEVAKPLVESTTQVYLVLMASTVMGAIFGLTFGLLGVMDEQNYRLRVALMQEEHYCYPIGTILGALTGFGNEYVRQQQDYLYSNVGRTLFDDDI
eukprot:GEMP01089207.1.p1 GENE.GEMP01089207.1~~GEMP01089207.1.p1  ORF type:complete len:268 (+),score=25.88 GEMP01089207.1:53-805(+)